MTISNDEFVRLFGTLNENQKKALTTTNNSILEIVAGPGTGKTKLLISRVAYLILNFKLKTSEIIVTTFTKKAAIEMKDRLNSLLINSNLQNLQIDTFHSICFGYLKYYGKFINLNKFSIADNKDQKNLLLDAINILNLNDFKSDKSSIKKIQIYISEKKSLGLHPNDIIINNKTNKFEIQYFQIYSKYQDLLKKNLMIDFDDILVYTYKLLTIKPECVSHVKHILIDEFQDTNTIQLKLIFKFSQFCNNNITIVGDADQSIYGFRNATYKNFKLLENLSLEKNKNFIKITLNQNYRSTNSILKISESLMRNQKERINKHLISNNLNNDPVYLINHNSSSDEPIFIANKINDMINNNNYNPKDFAIIVRVSRTFLSLERELSKKGIPYKIIKGQSFWDLKEISMTIDCLRIISNDDWLAYKRVIDWFVPGCGLKFIEKLENIIFSSNETNLIYGTVYNILTKFSIETKTGLSSKAKISLINFLSSIDECRNKLNSSNIHNFFNFVLDKFNIIENSLKKKSSSKNDDELKYDIIENLSELKNQLEKYNPEEDELLRKAQQEIFLQQDQTLSKDKIKEEKLNEMTIKRVEEENSNSNSKKNFLSNFLDHIYLAEIIACDNEINKTDETGRVILTTIHGSKGLEWPVVFLPSLIENIIPSKFSLLEKNPEKRESLIDEERRCFYVALTRSKDILYLSTYHDNENSYQPSLPSSFINEIPTDCYKNLSRPNESNFMPIKNNTFNKTVSFSKLRVPTHFKFQNFKHLNKFPIESPDSINNKSTQLPKPFPKQPEIVGGNGLTYNPVTGAAISKNGPSTKKRKRLGMGRPYKQLIPSKK